MQHAEAGVELGEADGADDILGDDGIRPGEERVDGISRWTPCAHGEGHVRRQIGVELSEVAGRGGTLAASEGVMGVEAMELAPTIGEGIHGLSVRGLLRESAGAGESLEDAPEIADLGVDESLGDGEGAAGVAGDGVLAESSGRIAVDRRVDGIEAFAMSIEEDDGDALTHQLMEQRHGEVGLPHADHPLQTEQRDLLDLARRAMGDHHPPVLQTCLNLPAIQVQRLHRVRCSLIQSTKYTKYAEKARGSRDSRDSRSVASSL